MAAGNHWDARILGDPPFPLSMPSALDKGREWLRHCQDGFTPLEKSPILKKSFCGWLSKDSLCMSESGPVWSLFSWDS